MTYAVYVDNELEETDLELEEALEAEADILSEDPEVEVRIAPMNEDMEELEDCDEEEGGDGEEEEE